MALFGGAKVDHPMADLRQAKKLIAELPANDALKALEEVTFWLDSVCRTEGLKLDHNFELFDMLDQAAKSRQRKLSQEYFSTERQEKFRENRLWTTMFEFWRMLGGAYQQCIEQFRAGASGAGSIKKQVPAIAGRALRTLTLQLKWMLLRYGPAEERVWAELGQMYQFAESMGIAVTPVEIYPGAHGAGTVQQELLKALMLTVSSTDGLTPVKQEIAERTVAHFGATFTMQSRQAPGCNFYFDLVAGKAPGRIPPGVEPGPQARYFGAGAALPALKQMMNDIAAKRSVPSDVNLGGTFDIDLVLSVMRHLAMYWSDTPPARSSERRKIATRMTVVHGYQQILESVTPNTDESSLDFNEKVEGESWIVENVSEGGFGAIIPQVKGDWIKVGSLLGVQAETEEFWGTGIVRRLTHDEFKQRRAGIQFLSKAVIPVKLIPAGSTSSFNAARDGDTAVLLSNYPDKNGEIALLLREGSFTSTQAYDMNVRDRKFYLMPSKLVEGGEEFDHARFRVMQRE
jgi:hypothetical protein